VALLDIADHDGIAVVRMDRPPANALDPTFIEAHLETLERLRADAPAAVVLTGTDAFFSGGADLKVVPTLGPDEQARMARGSNELFAAWYALPRPLVCAVNGHAVAGGLVLALAGDHRVSGTSGRFGLTEVKVGIPYPPSAMAVVQAELTPSVARRIVLRGELFDAKAMLDFCVFDEIVADDRVLDRALEIAATFAELPARTYEIIKRSLRREALKRAEDRRPETSISDWLGDETAAASAAVLGGSRE
jgi:enoyl-CoA hydratase